MSELLARAKPHWLITPPLQYPWADAPPKVETALTSRRDELSRIRARNALKILLDVNGDFGKRASALKVEGR